MRGGLAFCAGGGGLGLAGRAPPPTLGPLSLDDLSIAEDQPPGTRVGAITGATPGSTVTLHAQSNAAMFAKDGNDIEAGATALDHETAPAPTITLRETLDGATNSPHDTVIAITVTDVSEAASELIENGDFASAGPPPDLLSLVGSPPTIAGGQLIFDPAQESIAYAAWVPAETLVTGSVTVSLSTSTPGEAYRLRFGASAPGGVSDGTLYNGLGNLVDEVINVTAVDGQWILIEDFFAGNVIDSFSVTQ